MRPRVAELLFNTVGSGGGDRAAVPGPRHRGGLAGRAHRRHRRRGVASARWSRLLAVPAFINSYAWVSVRPTLHGSAPACWSPPCPTSRSCSCPPAATLAPARSVHRGVGAGAGFRHHRHLLPGGAAAAAAGRARRRTADRGASARRIRRVRDAAFLDVHHRHLRTVPGDVRRSRRAPPWPGCWCCCAWCCCWARHCCAATPASPGSDPARHARRPRSGCAPGTFRPPPVWPRSPRWRWACRSGHCCAGSGSAVPRSGRSPISVRHWARPRGAGRGGRRRHHRGGLPVRLAGGPLQRRVRADDRGRQLRHQFDARHRHRPRAGHRGHPVRSPAVSDRGAGAVRLSC